MDRSGTGGREAAEVAASGWGAGSSEPQEPVRAWEGSGPGGRTWLQRTELDTHEPHLTLKLEFYPGTKRYNQIKSILMSSNS